MHSILARQLRGVFYKLVILLPSAAALMAHLNAERLGPGTYHGYYAENRWGHKVFHTGPYHFFVGDAAKALQPHAGKPLEIKVLELSQPVNPGAGLIQEIGEIVEKGAFKGLSLSATLKSDKIVQGDGVSIHVTLRNDSTEEIKVWPCKLALILATDSPFENDAIGYKHPEDRAFWYYAYGYSPFEDDAKSPPMQIACHQIDVPTEKFGVITLAPKEAFEAGFTVGQELLPDDYEVFAYLTPGNTPLAEPMSKRLAFDVVPKAESPGKKLPGDGPGHPEKLPPEKSAPPVKENPSSDPRPSGPSERTNPQRSGEIAPAPGATAAGAVIELDGKSVAGYTLTLAGYAVSRDSEARQDLLHLLAARPLTFERDFKIPVDAKTPTVARLKGSIRILTKIAGERKVMTVTSELQLEQKEGKWYVEEESLARALKGAKAASLTPDALRLEEKRALALADSAVKDQALESLARGWAKLDHAHAESLARAIKDEATRKNALFYLAITFPTKDLDRAVAIARSFKDESQQADTLAAIVTSCANAGDFTAATKVAQSIKPHQQRVERLEFILRQICYKDMKAAKTWFASLPDADRAELKQELESFTNPPGRLRDPKESR